MKLKVYLICMLTVFLIFGIAGCGGRSDSDYKPEPTATKDGEHVKNEVVYQKAPVLTGDSAVYNIMDFGAAGNGRIDDTQAIREAIAYAAAAGGGTIYFPEGKYKVNEPIRIAAEGAGTITLAGDPNRMRETVIQSGPVVGGDLFVIERPDVHISYLSLKNNASEGSVLELASERSVITECTFLQGNQKNRDTAVVVSGSDNYIGSCYFGPGTTNGYIVRFTKKTGREMKCNTLADSYFGGNLPHSVLIDSEDSGSCPREIHILRNVFLFPAPGQVYIKAVDGCVIQNNMLDAATTAILLNPDENGIQNVDIRYNYMGSKNKDITGYEERTDMPGGVVTDVSGGGTITGVTITDNYFWGYYGVRITSSKFTDFSIINNYFVESNGASIYITDSVRNTIEGNIVYCGSEALYSVFIGALDEETVLRYNVISGACWIPNAEKYQQDNFF